MAEFHFYCSDGTELPVTVRTSTRAKNQRLTLNHQGQLEVVFPRRMMLGRSRGLPNEKKIKAMRGSKLSIGSASETEAPSPTQVRSFLEAHRTWIERAAKRTQAQREAYQLSKAAGLPTHLEFPPSNELWLVEYQMTSAQKVSLKRDGLRSASYGLQAVNDGLQSVGFGQNRFKLRLSGAVHEEEACIRALKRFVQQRAIEVLPAFGWRVCDKVGVRPREISVNNRKTAWGLCTRDGSIKLDRKLLFLPKDLAVQVVLHEIAHLRQMNHSKRFYSELFALEGSSQEAERAVKSAMIYIPAWLR